MHDQQIQKEIKNKIFRGARWLFICWIWMFTSMIFSPMFRANNRMEGKGLPLTVLYLSFAFAPYIVNFIPEIFLLVFHGLMLVYVSTLLKMGVNIVFLMAGLLVMLIEEFIFITPKRKIPLVTSLYIAYILTKANSWVSLILEIEAISIIYVLIYIAHKNIYRQFTQAEELRVLNEKLNQANQRIEKLTAERVHKEVARDLHDTLTQDFVGLNMRLTVIKQLAVKKDYSKMLSLIDDTQKMATSSIEQSRSMIKQYRNHNFPQEKQSLKRMTLDTIDFLKQDYSLNTKLTINHDASIGVEELVDIERVVSEALMNVVKHGETDQAEVKMVVDNDKLTVDIINYGKTWQPTKRDNHYGMINMKERTAKYNGSVEFQALEKGLKVTATFELK